MSVRVADDPTLFTDEPFDIVFTEDSDVRAAMLPIC